MAADVQQTPPTEIQLGDHVVLTKSRIGTVKFVGEVEFSEGLFFGIELHNAAGNHNGTVKGKSYFSCQPEKGLLVRRNIILSTHEPSKHPVKNRGVAKNVFQQVLTEHNVRKHTKRAAGAIITPGVERSNSPALSTNTEVASLTSSNLRRFDTFNPAKPLDPSKFPTIEQALALAQSSDKSADGVEPQPKLFDIRTTTPSLKTDQSNPCLSELFLNTTKSPAPSSPTSRANVQPGAPGISTRVPISLNGARSVATATASPVTIRLPLRAAQWDDTPEQHLAGQLMKLNIRRRTEWDNPGPGPLPD